MSDQPAQSPPQTPAKASTLADTTTRADQTFLATASHEIRTPLNGIIGMVSLLLETELAPAQREYAEAIKLSGSRLLGMLNNVLDYARLDAGDIELEETGFSPVDLTREVVELLAPRAHSANIDIGVRSFSAQPIEAYGDAGRIRQILFNLIGNALKFTEKGGVLIDIAPYDDAIKWSIIDTGPGISTKDQIRLFEAFQQAKAGDAQKDGGVGLGLAIVKRLTGMLGGQINVESAPGLGTSFRVTLPLTSKTSDGNGKLNAAIAHPFPARATLIGLPRPTGLSAAMALHLAGVNIHFASIGARLTEPGVILAGADLPNSEIARLSAIAPTLIVLRPEDRSMITRFRLLGAVGWLVRPMRQESLLERIALANAGNRNLGEDKDKISPANARILIADDNAVNTLIARRALEQAGFQITTAATGVEAIEAAKKIDYALILMDLRMPVMDGFETMRRLRQAGYTTPIIAISAEINPKIESEATACGANAVASKPLDAEALRALAQNWATRPSRSRPNAKKGAA